MIRTTLLAAAASLALTASARDITFGGKTYTLSAKTLLVDSRLTPSDSASGFAFRTIQEAVARLTDGTATEPMTVLFAPGVYWVNDPKTPEVATASDGREPRGMEITCQRLHFIGLCDDARDVVLASQRGQTQGAVGNFTMFFFHGDDLRFENMTLGNFCNVDLDYPRDPRLSVKKRNDAIVQAHVGYVWGDRLYCHNVRFMSRLNLNPLSCARRALYDHCHFECTDDALTYNGIYVRCTFDFYGQKPFYTTESCGSAMLGCHFRAVGGFRPLWFCKADGPLAVVDCQYETPFEATVGWANYPFVYRRSYQANFSLNGRPYTIGGRGARTVEIDNLPLLRAFRIIEAGGDTIYNTYNLVKGNDNWDPQGLLPRLRATGVAHADDFPTAMLMNVSDTLLTTAEAKGPLTLRATPRLSGNYAPKSAWARSLPLTWRVESGYEGMVRTEVQADGSLTVIPTNETDTTARFTIEAATPEGLRAACRLTVRPATLPAPAIVGKPKIIISSGEATLAYQLRLEGRKDCSDISWWRGHRADGKDAVCVAVTTGKPLDRYRITRDDDGCYLSARLMPAHTHSAKTEPLAVLSKKKISVKADNSGATREMTTDFSSLPTQWQPMVAAGYWTVDGCKPDDTAEFPWEFSRERPMWEYAEGFNGAVGLGLLQAQRGARLRYTPKDSLCGDMTLRLTVDPTKTAGQGFGSATGQYLDICLKMDCRTLTGYGLRIFRTPANSKAVDFQLISYTGGRATPISEAVTSDCYRTGCHITLQYTLAARANPAKARLTAEVYTDSKAISSPDLPHRVSLSADVNATTNAGLYIQHTGSTGESTTMLHRVEAAYGN